MTTKKQLRNLYYCEADCGCGLRRVQGGISEARQAWLREVGTCNAPGTVRPATEADVAWVQAMGGRCE
jgi:hypothetical protein